jgi:hypothetical protein
MLAPPPGQTFDGSEDELPIKTSRALSKKIKASREKYLAWLKFLVRWLLICMRWWIWGTIDHLMLTSEYKYLLTDYIYLFDFLLKVYFFSSQKSLQTLLLFLGARKNCHIILLFFVVFSAVKNMNFLNFQTGKIVKNNFISCHKNQMYFWHLFLDTQMPLKIRYFRWEWLIFCGFGRGTQP